MKHLISILVPILNIDCQKYIFGSINIFIVSGMRILLPDGSTPILLKTALPLVFDLSLSVWILGATCILWHPMGGAPLIHLVHGEVFIPFLGSLKRSSKRGFYVKPFIYLWTWKAYSLISVFAVYITFGWWTCLPGWIYLHTWPSHLIHFLWFDNLGTKWSIDPGIHCRLVSSRHC